MATAKLLALRSLQPVAPEGHEIPGPHGDSGCNMERQMVHLAHVTLSTGVADSSSRCKGLHQRELSKNESTAFLI